MNPRELLPLGNVAKMGRLLVVTAGWEGSIVVKKAEEMKVARVAL